MDIKIDRTYGYNMDIHKSKIIKCNSNNLSKINTVHSDIIIILSSESNYSIIHDSYLETEPSVSDNAGGDFGNDAIIRLYDCIILGFFSSIKLDTGACSTIEHIDYCRPNLSINKLFSFADDEYDIR